MAMARRPGTAFVGALLAIAAILGLFAVSSWHSAQVIDPHPVNAMPIGHVGGPASEADPDAPIHVVAHATSLFLTIAGEPMPTLVTALAERGWSASAAPFRDGSEPAGLMRPPRG